MRFGGRRRPLLSPDPDLVRALAQLLSENGLTEIEYAVGDRLIRVSRAAAAATAAASGAATTVAVAQSAPAAAPAPSSHPGEVTSPMVGTAYLAPQPGAPPFVRLGEAVVAGQPLLIIEAMKVMNEIRAPRAGRIAEILVEDGAPVEYGAPLMLIE